jgi:signal transduction histidine kinase
MNRSHAERWGARIGGLPGAPATAFLNRKTALPIAIAVWFAAAIGDFVTTAEVAFTLVYLIPIGIAVWWRDLREGLLIGALCTLSFLGTELAEAKLVSASYVAILAWNLVGQIGVFLAFAIVLDKLKKRLDVEMSERTSALEQLRHADRLNTVGKLASGIAHELGTPLNVVAGRASMIATQKVVGEDARRSAQVIGQQAERMTTIIRNLLTFARRGGSRRTSLDLARLVGETVALLEPLAKKQRVTLRLANGSPRMAAVNAGEIQQVLTNLIVNGVQAMPNGGTLTLEIDEIAVERGVEKGITDGSYARIRVRDEGTGIEPAVLPHIFDPFYTTKEVGAGTGLGLSVAFGIVRDHGGAFDVHTKLGEGTQFDVLLPENAV